MGTSWLLPRLIGASRSHELMLTGRRLDAEEALRIGLVADVVEEDKLLERAVQAAEQIAALAPWGVRLTKRGMWSGAGDPLRAGSRRVRGPPADHGHVQQRRPGGRRRVSGEAPSQLRRLAMSDLFDVSGKTALVTGGSRGIGLMIAEGLLRAGARVIVSSRKSADIEAAAEQLSALGDCHAVPADISTPEGARALAAATRERFPSLDILVNNAGAVWGEPLESFSPVGWQKILATNVEGIFYLTVALLPELRASAKVDEPARVINIGSIDGLRTPSVPNYSYSASKAAVHMLTRHLAHDLAAEHITVNAIAPGPFESRMMAWALDDPELRSAVEREVPLGRIGRGDDVAGLTIFLASRAGAYMTGTVIPLDGGITGCSSPGAVAEQGIPQP